MWFDNMIDIQICDVLNIPNFPKIYTGLTFNNISIKNNYIFKNSTNDYKININTIYFLDKPVENVNKNHLITFTLKDDIQLDNKSDIIVIEKNANEYESIKVTCDKKINSSQGICIFSNQYNVIKINYLNNNIYEIKNLDDSKFINLSKKIIIKISNDYYLTNLI